MPKNVSAVLDRHGHLFTIRGGQLAQTGRPRESQFLLQDPEARVNISFHYMIISISVLKRRRRKR